MINVKPFVLKALEETNINVSYFHPEDLTKLPCITYYEMDNSTVYSYNGEDILSNITYVVDIWDKKSTTDIAIKVDEKMMGLGFKRTSCIDLYEVDSKIHHKQLVYNGQITKHLFMYN